jgi:signal transduction histidine kinase
VADAAAGTPAIRPLRSVRVRITLAAVVATAVAMSAASWLLLRSVEDTQLGRVRDATEAYLDDVVEQLEDGLDPMLAAAPTIGTDAFADGPVFVQIVGPDGHTVGVGPTLPAGRAVLALQLEAGGTSTFIATGDMAGAVEATGTPGQAPATAGAPPATAGAPPATAGAPPATADPSQLQDRLVRMVTPDTVFTRRLERIVREVDTPTGPVTVYAATPVDEVQRSVDAVRRALWLGLPLLVAGVALVAWRLVGRALRPVEAIRSEVAAIGGATMHRRVPAPDTDDEIGRLAHTMNGMLDRLETAATRQRQFVADASHELRSPVAAIRTDLEVALAEGDAADWPAVARAVLAEESRLEHLLTDLLILAASDEGAGPPPGAVVDLGDVATAEAARPRRVPVGVTVDGRTRVVGSAAHLARVVANLVDNAARHAESRVRVTVGNASGDGAVRLTVDDDGPGIPPGDRARVFERFTRLDDARARDAGGAGLGLAVVRSIVGRHRGQVRIRNGPLGGAQLRVVLPAAGDASPAGTGSGGRH